MTACSVQESECICIREMRRLSYADSLVVTFLGAIFWFAVAYSAYSFAALLVEESDPIERAGRLVLYLVYVGVAVFCRRSIGRLYEENTRDV